jgi:hypothetical protein
MQASGPTFFTYFSVIWTNVLAWLVQYVPGMPTLIDWLSFINVQWLLSTITLFLSGQLNALYLDNHMGINATIAGSGSGSGSGYQAVYTAGAGFGVGQTHTQQDDLTQHIHTENTTEFEFAMKRHCWVSLVRLRLMRRVV